MLEIPSAIFIYFKKSRLFFKNISQSWKKIYIVVLSVHKIIYVPRVRNQFADFLGKTAKTFHRKLFFIGCSIPIWLSRPPQVWVIERSFGVKKKKN